MQNIWEKTHDYVIVSFILKAIKLNLAIDNIFLENKQCFCTLADKSHKSPSLLLQSQEVVISHL